MSAEEKRREKFIKDFEQDKSKYEKYADHVLSMIKNALDARQIDIAYSSARVKSIDSLEKKCKKTIKDDDGNQIYKYNDCRNEIMDLAGVRIVTYLLEDLDEVSKVIKDLFNIVEEHSGNKLDLLGADRIGYLSVHYIVKLNDEKIVIGEESFRGLKCEIQVRTVLEDAWAQIFHDRQYKSEMQEEVTENLARRTNLLSGNLELLDYQINELVKKYDELNRIDKRKKVRNILEKPISRDNLISYIDIKLEKKVIFYNYDKAKGLLDEFNIKSIRELDVVLQDTHCEEHLKMHLGFLTADKIISYLLIIKDGEKFFKKIGPKVLISAGTYEFLKEFIDIDKICDKYGIYIENGR